MKLKIFLLSLLCMLSICIPRNVSSDPHAGLYKITIQEGWNFISLPLQTLQLSQGKITSLGTNTITDNTKSWTTNDYQNDILIISSGSGEGYWYKISSNTSDTITLSSNLASSISASDYFYVYKAYTITELFGDSNGPLYAGSNGSEADQIYLWNISTQAFSTSIWLSNVSGQEGWWQGSTKITDNSVTLLPNEACFVVHKPSSDATINYIGIVPDTKQTLNIKSGDNILGESFPASVTMSNSGLSSVLQAGTSSYTADNVYKWNYNGQKFGLPIWLSNYPGYENWYQGSNVVDSNTLDPAEGFMIKNRSTETNWQRTKPYNEP